MAQTGLLGWSHLELAAVKPFHPRTFWKHANTLYRHFSVFFLANALHVSVLLCVQHLKVCCHIVANTLYCHFGVFFLANALHVSILQ